ncbi:hypothetical protein VTN00DRAFT_4182 [Thermoascus crustaceus]|uniref:uncharacterized protein n=1 Tax=Thermoascus crustaceus TaxID=5088 RepID=UPI003743FD31
MQSPSAREIPVARYAVDSPSSWGSLISGIQRRDSEQLIPSAEEGQGGDATPQPIPNQQVDDTSMNSVPGTRLSSERELTALGMSSTGSYQDALSDDYFSRILESLDASHNVNTPGQTTGTVIDCHSPPLLGVPRQLTYNTVGGEHEQTGLDSDIVISHSQFRPLRTQMDQPLLPLSNSVCSSRPPTQGVSTSSTLFSSGSDSTSPSSFGASSIPVRDSCKCTGTALRILEAVAMPVKVGDWSTTEQELYSLKGNIWQCHVLSQCTSCRQDSGFTILMLILCEKITGIFEEVAAGWERQLRASASAYHTEPGWTDISKVAAQEVVHHWEGSQQEARILLGKYQIDTAEERCEVFGSLILLQLNKLVGFFSEVKKTIVSSKWESHFELLKTLSHRIKDLRATLRHLSSQPISIEP